METTNNTLFWDFFLEGFSCTPGLEITVFAIIMFLFCIMIFGNIGLITIICTNHCLHLPMYYFLVALSLLEILTNIILVPKILAIIIAKQTAISKGLCLTQCFLYFFFMSSCFLILGVMSFDRYVAICHPLRYSTIMRKEFCIQLVLACLVISICTILYPLIVLARLPYCSHILDHLFCDNEALLRVACVQDSILRVYGLFTSVIVLLVPLIITLLSYILIVSTVIRLPSDTGKQKTFSTCLGHLTMVVIVFGSGIFLEMRPPSYQSVQVNKVVILGSTMVAPLVNPIVYTLRNKNVKNSIVATFKRIRVNF